VEAGDRALKAHGKALPEKSWENIRKSDCCLKAPVGESAYDVIIRLRRELDLYANIRPAKSLPNVPSLNPHTDLVIVRENTEDLYSGLESGDNDRATATRVISRRASERIAKCAFDLARERRKTVTAIHKANVMKKLKVSVLNQEFGTTATPAPPSRTYQLVVSDGSCPNGTVSQVDADASTTALDTTASVPLGKKVKGSFYVTFNVQDVTSVSKKIPFRCTVNVEADVVDPALNGAPDDAALVANNSTSIDLEVVDKNDLP
jgi:hypothetical protein